MLPSPIKPIFMWLPRCCCQAVGRAVHAVRGGGAAPTMFLVLPPLCGSPARGRAVPWACFARRSQRGRCSYTPLWEPCPWGKGRVPGRAGHAVRSEGAAPTHRCGALPAGGRAVPGGRWSYSPLWELRPRGEWRAARARSVVLGVRLALLDERLHPLGLVGGGEDRVEHPTLEAHAFGQAGLEYAVDAFLGHHHARERLAGDDLGGFQGFFQQLVDREDP